MKKRNWIIILAFIVLCFFTGMAFAAAFGDSKYSVCFVNEKEGWAAGARGALFHSSDGGLNWEKQNVKTTVALLSISFCNPQVGWVVGDDGIILHTVDGGKTWNEQVSPKNKMLLTVKAISPERCLAAGDWGTIVYTADGGKTWVDKTYPKDVVFNIIDFQGEDVGWIAGEFGTILHTVDGGKSWTLQQSGTDATILGISFASRQHGVAVGMVDTMLKTDDGGRTWQKVVRETTTTTAANSQEGDFTAIYDVKLRGSFGIVVGEHGRILTTADGGKTWRRIPIPLAMSAVWLRGVDCLGDNKAVAVGMRGIVIITEDDKIKMMGFLPTLRPVGK